MIGSVSLSVGGAILAARGVQNCYQGKTNLGKYQVLAGALALAGGAYLLISQNESSTYESLSLERIQKECEKVLTEGYQSIPKMDLKKHIRDVGPNFADGRANPRCDVELTTEGSMLFNQLGLQHTKHIFKAVVSDQCTIHGVIRHY